MQPTDARMYDARVDQLRALGFLAVVAVHFFIPTFQSAVADTPIISVLTPLVLNGHFGVSFFFFLSGYILSRLAKAGGGQIDYKWFLYNRVLRLYPVWVVCVVITTWESGLKAGDVMALLGLFTQNLPKDSPFAIAWSVQTEMYLYLLFPVLFINVTTGARLAALLATLFLIRLGLAGVQTSILRNIAYASLLGALPIFSAGVFAGRLPRLPVRLNRALLLIPPALYLWLIAYYITWRGGFHSDAATPFKDLFWVAYPEILGVGIGWFVVVYEASRKGVLSKTSTLAGLLFALIGKVSYSGYMFHIFIMHFFGVVLLVSQNLLGLPLPAMHGLALFALYLCMLIPASYLSFKVIEEPFLRLRKPYLKKLEIASRT